MTNGGRTAGTRRNEQGWVLLERERDISNKAEGRRERRSRKVEIIVEMSEM